MNKSKMLKLRKKPGGSNVGKKTFANGSPRTGPYVGPSGGAPQGSYPIPDINHARAALALAHHAPNPEGIKAAVKRKYPQLKRKGGMVECADGGTIPSKKQKNPSIMNYKNGNWIQGATASIKRRGTEGKCTPITKPGCTGRARALALTFKKMARMRKKG